jgi:FeS assembly SUF system protein
MDKILEIEQNIVTVLKSVYDPEIPVNIYDMGLIYKIDVSNDFNVEIDMTLTAPNCPMVDDLVADVQSSIKAIPEVKSVNVNIVFDPPWSKDLLSEAAKLDLGLL